MHAHVHASPQIECSRWRLPRLFMVASTCTTLTYMLLLRRDGFSSYTGEPKPLLEEQSCFFGWVFFFRNHGVTAAWRLYFYVQCKSRDWEREWRGALAAHVYVCTPVQVVLKTNTEGRTKSFLEGYA